MIEENQKNKIKRFFPVEGLENLYNPKISDPVKDAFDADYFNENKLEFVKLWIGLFCKFPREYLESFLCNSYGYWYPEFSYWVVATETANTEVEEIQKISLEQTPIIKTGIIDKLVGTIEKRNVPIFAMIYSIGFAFWITLFLLFYCIYKKAFSYILIFVPIIALWLTNLASPVCGEFRYMYSLFTCLPIYFSLIDINKKFYKKDKGENIWTK